MLSEQENEDVKVIANLATRVSVLEAAIREALLAIFERKYQRARTVLRATQADGEGVKNG